MTFEGDKDANGQLRREAGGGDLCSKGRAAISAGLTRHVVMSDTADASRRPYMSFDASDHYQGKCSCQVRTDVHADLAARVDSVRTCNARHHASGVRHEGSPSSKQQQYRQESDEYVKNNWRGRYGWNSAMGTCDSRETWGRVIGIKLPRHLENDDAGDRAIFGALGANFVLQSGVHLPRPHLHPLNPVNHFNKIYRCIS